MGSGELSPKEKMDFLGAQLHETYQETDTFVYRPNGQEYDYTLTLNPAIMVCARRVVSLTVEDVTHTFKRMHDRALALQQNDPEEYQASIDRANKYLDEKRQEHQNKNR